MKVGFQISMDYLESGVEEVKSLLETYALKHNVVKKVERFLIVDIPDIHYHRESMDLLYRILSRSATIKRALLIYREFKGEIREEDLYSDDLCEFLHSVSTAAIHVHYFNSSIMDSSSIRDVIDKIYGVLFKGYKGKIALSQPEMVIALYNIYDYNWIGIEIYEESRKGFEHRRSKYRPVFSPFSLHPKLSRLMINLARVREGDLIVDPFCGVGSIPMESSLIGVECICMELRYKWCLGCLKNIEWVDRTVNFTNIVNVDSLKSIWRKDDIDFSIVTDPPYGRITSTGGHDPSSIYKEFIENYVIDAKSSVFMSPYEIDELLMNYELIISFKDVIPVHSNLTRYLYVVMR